MCKPEGPGRVIRAPVQRKNSLLLTQESFNCNDEGKGPNAPTKTSSFATIAFFVGLMFAAEHLVRYVIEYYQHVDPLFMVGKNRMILARHIATDFICCATVAALGIKNRRIIKDLASHAFGRSNSMPEAGFEKRIFSYHPASQQLLLIFFAYQVKNMYDTIIWNDGPEFILHHIFAGGAAWGGMYPGCCHFYAIFFMGISEISTAILCLLANFDPDHGVIGLDEAFPTTRIILAALFVVAFLACRTIMWPYVTYHFTKDSLNALKSGSEKLRGRKFWIWAIMVSCGGLTVIQIVWLFQIFIMARQEIAKLL